jgi:hypothetical protein
MFRQIDKTQFQTLKKAMREARNKFIAHLDDEKVEYTPYMNIAKDTVRFYHSYIVENADPGDLAGLPIELDDYYSACSREAEKIYARLVRSW